MPPNVSLACVTAACTGLRRSRRTRHQALTRRCLIHGTGEPFSGWICTQARETSVALTSWSTGRLSQPEGVLDMPLAEWTRQTAVILTGAFLLPSTSPVVMTRTQWQHLKLSPPPAIKASRGTSATVRARAVCSISRARGYGTGRIRIRVNSLTPTATMLQRVWLGLRSGRSLRRPTNPSPRRRGVLSGPRQGYRSASAPVHRTTPKLQCFLAQMMPR